MNDNIIQFPLTPYHKCMTHLKAASKHFKKALETKGKRHEFNSIDTTSNSNIPGKGKE